ncbi:glycosyltransferase family 2 protein [Colwellia sp. RE-S-Sl-9]
MQYCFVIPCYNHDIVIRETIASLCEFNFPIIIVDDGSQASTREILKQVSEEFPLVTLIHHQENGGKGAAMQTGLAAAINMNMTHALQVDADGQHDLLDINQFIKEAADSPESLISGQPVYDDSISKGRFYGRYITHFWVGIETLSCKVIDSMCGFRVYPLAAYAKLIQNTSLGKRMDFDIEVMVKLIWQGVPVKFVQTKVHYPEFGISHFHAFKDNVIISKMHTRLFFGMLLRLPKLLAQKWNKKAMAEQPSNNELEQNKPEDLHWSKLKERGFMLGIEVLVFVHKYLGNWLFKVVLFPVMIYFYLTGDVARKSIHHYLSNMYKYKNNVTLTQGQLFRKGFKVFYNFGLSIVDKFDAWLGKVNIEDIDIKNDAAYQSLINANGAVIFSAHLGNMEVCRAIFSTGENKRKLNVITYNEHTPSFNNFLKKVNKDAAINFIHINDFGPADSIQLKQKIEDGEAIVIFADRTSVNNPDSVYNVPFIGEEAPFAKGPFALASIMDCKVFLMFCLKEEGRYSAYVEEFAQPKKVKRKERNEYFSSLAEKYAQRLEFYCRKEPYQWFNFFSFWQNKK